MACMCLALFRLQNFYGKGCETGINLFNQLETSKFAGRN